MPESTLDRAERLDEVNTTDLTDADLIFACERYLPYYRESGFSGHNRMAELVDELISRYGRS